MKLQNRMQFDGNCTLSRGILTMICITFIMPHSIQREAAITILRAKFPYITVFMEVQTVAWAPWRAFVASITNYRLCAITIIGELTWQSLFED
ncbi:hypothetical protein FGO68_gene7535 [Halteria grandinella]|uniref:Uncharacterized protein n=1 Tax=Halteria grandinella TaxID=5974 RepID=A0A8J8SU50_HALGN|nr:hypothetical protein FGO68_gene7535 [Halteria grandinella]